MRMTSVVVDRFDLLVAVSRALDFVEQEFLGATTNHSRRVAVLCAEVCRLLRLGGTERLDMVSCALLHDNALTEGRLGGEAGGAWTRAEAERMEAHCRIGESNALHFPSYGDCRGVVLHHHERWDGRGFFGLSGEAIPLRAAVLYLADHLDVLFDMGTASPEKTARIREAVRKGSGTLYAPHVARAFLTFFDEKTADSLTHGRIEATLAAMLEGCRRTASGPLLETEALLRLCGIFAGIIDAKSPFTFRHTKGIVEKTRVLARRYGLEPERERRLAVAAGLHDLGKLSTPLRILEKPGPLDADEFAVMRLHVAETWNMLSAVRGMEDMALWAASHHERLDGTGYPFAYARADLPFESRLLACVDVYQALREERPYRASMSHEAAMRIMLPMGANNKLDGRILRDIDEALAESEA